MNVKITIRLYTSQVFSDLFLNYFYFMVRLQIYTVVLYICITMKIETENLKTVGNYAKKVKRNRSRIYQLINTKKIETVKIDGVTFIKV